MHRANSPTHDGDDDGQNLLRERDTTSSSSSSSSTGLASLRATKNKSYCTEQSYVGTEAQTPHHIATRLTNSMRAGLRLSPILPLHLLPPSLLSLCLCLCLCFPLGERPGS